MQLSHLHVYKKQQHSLKAIIRERSVFMARGGQKFRDLFSLGGDFLKHILKGGGAIFFKCIISAFFPQKLHYMYYTTVVRAQ